MKAIFLKDMNGQQGWGDAKLYRLEPPYKKRRFVICSIAPAIFEYAFTTMIFASNIKGECFGNVIRDRIASVNRKSRKLAFKSIGYTESKKRGGQS